MTQYMLRALAAIAALALGIPLFLATGMDDPYISFWSAHTLVEFGEILNYNGVQVEQSSSLLHTLILAAAKWLTGAPFPILGYWCGVLFAGLAAFRAPDLARRMRWGESTWLVLLVGTAPCLLFYAFGSLETTIVAWLSVEVAILATDIADRRRAAFSPLSVVVTLAYVMVRPEAGIVLGTCLIGWIGLALVARRLNHGMLDSSRIAPVVQWLLLVVVAFTALSVFRLLYFGEIFPQPVAMKVGGDLLSGLAGGGKYTTQLVLKSYGIALAFGLLAVPLVAIRELRKSSWEADRLLVLLLIGANASFVIFSGGDWMPAGRFFVHFSPLVLVVLFGLGFDANLSVRPARALIAFWLILNVTGTVLLATHRGQGRPIWAFIEKDPLIREQARGVDYSWVERANQFHTRDILVLGELSKIVETLLEEKETVTLMSGQAGMNAYYLAMGFYGQIEFFDRRALSTKHFEALKDELEIGTSRYGLDLSLERFFAEAGTRTGPLWSPDIIFDVVERDVVEDRSGYRLVHVQVGTGAPYLENPDAGLYRLFGPRGSIKFKCRLPLSQYVAVRDALATRFEPSYFDWDQERRLRLAGGAAPAVLPPRR